MKYFYSANDFYLDRYKEKVYKIALDGGMSCPNRDKDKNGGCIFCSKGGSGDFAIKYESNIKEQITKGINLVKSKGANKFIAYFQSYTNTYQSIDYLRKIFYDAISDDRIVALSIATRPDSISDECYKLLDELNKIKDVYVELGLQTINDNTALIINRGYETKIYDLCTYRLRNLGINVITHLIIGLPGENIKDSINSIKYINDKTDGVKLQLLHVLKDTKLFDIYMNDKYTPLEKEDYIKIVSECIECLNPKIVVHRITGDGDKKILVAPMYSSNKKDMLNSLNKYFKDNNVYQGKKYVL